MGCLVDIPGQILALSIGQPCAELIRRGIKTVECRTRPTRIKGERFHIYTPLKKASADRKVWCRDLAVPRDALPEWMIGLAEQVGIDDEGGIAHRRYAG